MMMRSPEKPTAEPEERPEPGTSKGTAQKKRAELIKTRAPLRQTVTLLHVKLRELISREGSHTFLKKKMDEAELAWEQCRKIDKLLLEILSEREGDEALSKEEETQYEFEEKMDELREAAEKYLKKRMMDPPSIAGSRRRKRDEPRWKCRKKRGWAVGQGDRDEKESRSQYPGQNRAWSKATISELTDSWLVNCSGSPDWWLDKPSVNPKQKTARKSNLTPS